MKGLAILALSAFAAPSVWAKPVDGAEKFLIETAPGETQWVTEAEKFELKAVWALSKKLPCHRSRMLAGGKEADDNIV